MDVYWVLSAFTLLFYIPNCDLAFLFPESGDAEVLSGIDASLDLGLKILWKESSPNTVISPACLTACLKLLYAGARGDTKTELGNVLGRIEGESSGAVKLGQLADVQSAVATFVDASLTVKSDYLNVPDHSVYSINFADGEASRQIINEWVSAQTNETIKNLISEPVDSATYALVISALYFNASWLYPFNPVHTKLNKFETLKESIDVPFMTRDATYPLFRGSSYVAVGLPYFNNDFTLYFLLPNAAGPRALKNMIRHLSPAEINKMASGAQEESVIVTIPKFTLDFSIKLRPILQSLGVNKIFDPNFADFGDLLMGKEGEKQFVSDILQSVHLEVDESGTRGGAATATFLTKSSRLVFRANRPFAYVLRHATGHVLFLGAYTSPKP